MMSHMTRKGDASKGWWTAAGLAVLAAAFLLALLDAIGDSALIALAVVGAGMLRPDFIIDLVKAWRKPKPEDPTP